jgi:hypothetical protein
MARDMSLKSTVNLFAVSAKVGGNVFYAIAIGNINRNPRKFLEQERRKSRIRENLIGPNKFGRTYSYL